MDKTEPDLLKPIAAYKADPRPLHADAFLAAAKPILDTGLATYGGGNVNPMMRARGRRVLLDSARSFDPARGASFRTHAMNQLRTLQRYNAKQQRVLAVPEGVVLDGNHLRGAEAELRDRLGRDPSDGELADHTGMSRRRIAHVRGYKPGLAEGQLDAVGAEEGEGGFEPGVAQADPTLRHAEFLYHDLDPTDQVILEYSLGLNGSPRLSGAEVARRVRLSPGAVSQRKARIDGQLRELADTGVL